MRRFRRPDCRIISRKTSLSNKFARRFVMDGRVIIHMRHRYVVSKALRRRDDFCFAAARLHREIKMRKTILTILGSALLAAFTVQFAAAGEHHKSRKIYRAPAPVSEDFRNSNDFYAAPHAWGQPDWSRYQYGAGSAPAGH